MLPKNLKEFVGWFLTACMTSLIFGCWQRSALAGLFMFFFLVSLYGIAEQSKHE